MSDLLKRLDDAAPYARDYGFAARCVEAAARIRDLEAQLAALVAALRECEAEIDQYIRQEYPGDHPVHERYRQRDFAANPARVALAAFKGGADDRQTP